MPITRILRRAAALLLMLCGAAAHADSGYYVVTVYDDPGAKTVDFRYWTFKPRGSAMVRWPEVGLGWNVNGRWYTEVLESYVGSSQFATKLEAVEWQNDVLLTQGQYPFDLAIHTLLVRPQHPASGSSVEIGPVFQTDIGRTQLNFNLIFSRGFGAESTGSTELAYQWQVRYRWTSWLHVGAQGLGELGPWDDWQSHEAQSHRAGPALFGSIPLGSATLKWQAAYLIGKFFAQRGDMFTMRAKVDF